MPFTWIMACFIFSLITKNIKLKKRTLYTAVILLLFFSNGPLINQSLKLWEIPITPYAEIKEPYDVAILLTGIVEGGKPVKDRVYFGNNVDRLTNTLDLYKKGKIKNILITGGTFQLFKNKDDEEENESVALANFLKECGVPDQNIFIEPEAKNTRENALFSAKILKEKFPDKKYLLVTSAFHMRRAHACFTKAGVTTTSFSTDLHSHKELLNLNSFMPQEEAFSEWHGLLHEIIGYLVYKTMGYC